MLISAGTKNRPCLTTKPIKTQTQNKTRQNYYANMPFQDFFLHTLSGGELKRFPAYSHTPEIQANCTTTMANAPIRHYLPLIYIHLFIVYLFHEASAASSMQNAACLQCLFPPSSPTRYWPKWGRPILARCRRRGGVQSDSSTSHL